MTVSVQLYMKPGCHLCEQTLTDLERLRRRHPHTVDLVDITGDDALLRRYGERIPVVAIGEREYAAPLTAADLERALDGASDSKPESDESLRPRE